MKPVIVFGILCIKRKQDQAGARSRALIGTQCQKASRKGYGFIPDLSHGLNTHRYFDNRPSRVGHRKEKLLGHRFHTATYRPFIGGDWCDVDVVGGANGSVRRHGRAGPEDPL